MLRICIPNEYHTPIIYANLSPTQGQFNMMLRILVCECWSMCIVNNYILKSYRFVIVVTTKQCNKKNHESKDYIHVIKTYKRHEKSKNKFNRLMMDQQWM